MITILTLLHNKLVRAMCGHGEGDMPDMVRVICGPGEGDVRTRVNVERNQQIDFHQMLQQNKRLALYF